MSSVNFSRLTPNLLNKVKDICEIIGLMNSVDSEWAPYPLAVTSFKAYPDDGVRSGPWEWKPGKQSRFTHVSDVEVIETLVPGTLKEDKKYYFKMTVFTPLEKAYILYIPIIYRGTFEENGAVRYAFELFNDLEFKHKSYPETYTLIKGEGLPNEYVASTVKDVIAKGGKHEISFEELKGRFKRETPSTGRASLHSKRKHTHKTRKHRK